jgi:PAS domain-containing protein
MLSGGRQAVVRDITERKRAEEALKKHARELGQLIDVAPSHMFIWEPDGKSLYGNCSARDYFGSTPPILPMEFFGQVAHPDEAEKLKE